MTVNRDDDGEGSFELVSRSQEIKVKQEVDDLKTMEIAMVNDNVLHCKASALNATHLSWMEISDDDHEELTDVYEDFVDTLPLKINSDTGVQEARERLYWSQPGLFACVATFRTGESKMMKVQTYENGTWDVNDVIVEDADNSDIEDWITQELLLILVAVNITFLCCCLLVTLFCFCRNLWRRRKFRRRHYFPSGKPCKIGVKGSEKENQQEQNMHQRKERSLKRQAPKPNDDSVFLSFKG